MRAVDTNVLVRLMVRDEEVQAPIADRFIEGGAWVSILVLAEATWVFETVYRRSASDVASAVQTLIDHENLTLQDSDAVEAALELFRARPTLGFSDCVILHLARKAGICRWERSIARWGGLRERRSCD